jgi:hypothetical protein
MFRVIAAAIAIVVMTAVANGQGIVREMTPELIAEAKTIPKEGYAHGLLLAQGIRPVGEFSTPFMRVRALAAVAKREYRTLEDSALTAEILEPELHIYAFAIVDAPYTANVKTVVITGRKGSPDAKAVTLIRPTRMEPIPATYKNAFGAEFTGDGMLAVFPLGALSKDREVHIVYDQAVPYTMVRSSVRSCIDCAARFHMKDVR